MGKTSGKALAEKYGGFLNPVVKVIAADRQIKPWDGIYLQNVQVISSVGKEPDMAVLVYQADKFPKQTHEQMEQYLNVGQKMEIMAGYGKELSRIFLGYLHEVEAADFMEEYVEYTLICLDVKGLMKKNSVFQISGSKNIQQVMEDILGSGCYGSFIEKKKMDSLPNEMNQDCVIKGETHYDWLCSLAEYMDYEFFCGRGELNFRRAEGAGGELLDLTKECRIEMVRMAVTMTEQTGSIQICGHNRKDQKIMGTAGWPGISHPFGNKMKQALSGSMLAFWDNGMETAGQAKQCAEARMNRSVRKSTCMETRTVGIPEFMPGICAKVTDEEAESLSGEMYVQEVQHLLDENGYRTVAKGVWRQI